MKKFLAIALFIVLVASVLVVASTAANAPIYWEIDSQCYVEAKELIDSNGNAYVTTFKAVKDFPGIDGMLLGVPADTTYGDDLFQAKDGYTIAYYDYEGRKINQDSEHIGTTDRLVVFKDGVTVAEYGLVTYGDVTCIVAVWIFAILHNGRYRRACNHTTDIDILEALGSAFIKKPSRNTLSFKFRAYTCVICI